MELTFLGTCCGSEPMPTRKHASFVLKSADKLYWFDAGEACSQTAHLLGLDLLAVDKIIISHTHMEHIGGLGNLLWNIRKINNMTKKLPYYGDVDVYIPDLDAWNGLWTLLRHTEGNFRADFAIVPHLVSDGVLFDDGTLKVTAFHNHHLQKPDNTDPWRSFTYLIEGEGKRIVYSGDVGSYSDMDEAIGDGCDALIVETGHYHIDDVYAYTRGKDIGCVYFTHCGREFLNFPAESGAKVTALFGDAAIVCEDGMTVTV